MQTRETCVSHPGHVYSKYCERCQVPVCEMCSVDPSHASRSFLFGQVQHKTLDIQEIYKIKRQQHRGTIQTMKIKTVFYTKFLLPRIKADIKSCRKQFSLYQSDMLKKTKTLKIMIDCVLLTTYREFNDHFRSRYLKQNIETIRHIVSFQTYISRYEQSANNPVQFLSSIKTALLPDRVIHLPLIASKLSETESSSKEDVMESLSGIEIREKGNRCVGNECQLKLTSSPEICQRLRARGVEGCYHISCVTSDRVWVSDGHNLNLLNATGRLLHTVRDLCNDLHNGFHTVNSKKELLYINWDNNIKKLSKDMKTTSTFIKKTDSTWKPQCVCWSMSTGNLLVGICRKEPWRGRVTRFNHRGQLTQTIEHDNTGRALYSDPIYITENNNWDVVVSDNNNALVVTESGGEYRFSYKGHPPGSGLWPCGICTDELSNILVCDDKTNSLQILNRDGKFLSHLLTDFSKMCQPLSLGYDIITQRLWVGTWDSKVSVYKYITRQNILTDEPIVTTP